MYFKLINSCLILNTVYLIYTKTKVSYIIRTDIINRLLFILKKNNKFLINK